MPKAQDTVDPTEQEFREAKSRTGQAVIAFSLGSRCRFYDEDAILVDLVLPPGRNKIFYLGDDGYSAAQMATQDVENSFDQLALKVNVPCVIMAKDRGQWLPVTIWQNGVVG